MVRRNKWKSGISFVLTAAMVAGSLSVASPVAVTAEEAAGTTYYIDAANGDDANAGTSENAAWKSFANVDDLTLEAGDSVLLKAGCTWNNEKLFIKNAKGTQENPVVLGKYGEGANPVINGNGNPWNDGEDISLLAKEDVAVVHVQNSEYITVQDLEVTNWEKDTADLMGELDSEAGVIYDQSKSMLTGILVENNDAGELKGVVVQNNYVHDVNGYMSTNGSEGHKKGSGGIMVLVTGGNTESYYTDLQILGNKVEKVCHEAIYMESCWAARTLVGGANSQQAGSQPWVGWPNVYVAHNYVNNVAGDGIVLINADGGTAEYNLVTASASEEWDYSRNPAHAAIWMWDCNNVTMQYNEAAYTTSTQDGMAFDCDYGNQNVMYQYNYSHDNKGGFWMACPGPYYTVNSVVRYNVSVNDGLFDGGRIMRVGEYGSIGHQVYNNTIYWDTDYEVNAVEQGSWGTPPTSGTDIYNNIFCGDSDTFVNNEGIHYDSNLVWGSIKDIYPTDEDANAVIADPKFVNVKDFTTGTFDFETGKVTLGKAEGFKVQADSPAINRGRNFMAVPEESFPAVEEEIVSTQITLENKDYEGNAIVDYVDIGAFEYQGKVEIPAVNTDNSYVESVISMVEGYSANSFTAATWKKLQQAVADAKFVVDRPFSTQASVDGAAAKLENALIAMERTDAYRDGSAEDDILAAYNASDSIDNSGFEAAGSDWGYWQSTVSVSSEQARNGEQSLKVVQDTAGTTGYSELGGVPVAPNTDYVFEAWIYCGEEDPSLLGLEAKHHANVTGSSDIKLATMTLSSDAETDEKGWRKAVMYFTTGEYEKISIALSSNTATAYLDDVILYPAQVSSYAVLDRTEIETTLALVPEEKEAYYSNATWSAYAKALNAAKMLRVDAMAEQVEINAAATALQEAFGKLTKKANFIVLNALYDVYTKEAQGNYTAETWNAFQAALQQAKPVLDNENALQSEVDTALAAVKTARNALVLVAVGQDDPVEYEQLDTPTVKSAKASGGKKLVVKWAKDSSVDGYEVQVALKKNFKTGLKKATVKKANKTSVTIKKLKKGRKYYVRIRSYKTVDGTKLYSDWSKVKTSGKVR